MKYRGWKQAARQGWRSWLKECGLDSGRAIQRPTERTALNNLEARALTSETLHALPLSALEMEIYHLERVFMRTYQTGAFMERYGEMTLAQKYSWVAAQMPGLSGSEVRRRLEEIMYVVDAYLYDLAVHRLLLRAMEEAA